MGVMKVMSRAGDDVYVWGDTLRTPEGDTLVADGATEMSEDEVRSTFDALVAGRYMVYQLDTKTGAGLDGAVTRTFDPDADTLLVTPPMVGG